MEEIASLQGSPEPKQAQDRTEYSLSKNLNAPVSFSRQHMSPDNRSRRLLSNGGSSKDSRMSKTLTGFGAAGKAMTSSNKRAGVLSTTKEVPDDMTLRRTGLSVGQVAGTVRTSAFGFDFYGVPHADHKYRIVNTGENKEKRKNFADLEAASHAFVPGPKYMKQQDWRENIPGRTGKFLCKNRKTFTDDVMEYEHNKPAPSKYDNKEQLKKLQKVQGSYTYNDTRVHFTEHKQWVAKQYPPAKYDNTNMVLVKPRGRAATMGRPPQKETQSWVIPKSGDPGPGSYKVEEVFVNQQWGKVKGQARQTFFPQSFTDQHKGQFKHVPGSGHYKNLEKGDKIVCKDVAFKYKRH